MITKTTSNNKETPEKIIWIDLDNSPHVPFFHPIIKELNNKGYRVMLTARDCFQVRGLADRIGLTYRCIGRHYGKNKLLKIIGTLYRSSQLIKSIRKENPSLFVSHGSRGGIIASAMLGIPIITIIDYEFAQEMPFVHPAKILVPEVVSSDNYGKNKGKVVKYPGIKEDVYVPDFKPDPGLLTDLGLSENELIISIRPPATEAHYHNPEAETLFEAAVTLLGNIADSRLIILPRNEKKQTAWIKNRWNDWCNSGKIIIPQKVVDGLNLMWHSDLVISGGGTMNREAAALGIPVYSIFRGKIGAVDRFLSDNGRLVLLESVEDVSTKIKPVKRDKSIQNESINKHALNKIVSEIVDSVENPK